MIAEYARHFDTNRTRAAAEGIRPREVWRLDLRIPQLHDLRDPQGAVATMLDQHPACFTDIPLCRATAHFLRTATSTQGLLVPSVAFLDKAERWVLVLFLEKLPVDPHEFLTRDPEKVGQFGYADFPPEPSQ